VAVGHDPAIEGFFWRAGQGGSGVSTSPAYGRIAAELLVHGQTQLFDPTVVDPARFTG
jgi:D-arginine dehydrogenase